VPPLRDQAIVLRQWEFSETSQTAALFTRDHGVLRGLAKGSRRDRGSFCGGLEVLTRGEIGAIVKPNTELATLTDWDLQEVFWSCRRDLLAHRAGLYVVDLIHHSVHAADPHPSLFDEALATLRSLDRREHTPAAVLKFQWRLLAETGHQPRLAPEAGSRSGEINDASVLVFSPLEGGIVPSPPPHAGGADAPGAWRVRSSTINLLRALESGRAEATDDRAVDVVRASRLLGAFVHVLLERELAAHAAYFTVLDAASKMGVGQPPPIRRPSSPPRSPA